jgi:hypothetical protein
MRTVSLSLLLLAGCKCLPVPTADTTPPTAGVLVEFREPGGQRVTRSAGAGDPNITVMADKTDVVAVVYSGGDNEGVRSVELVYDMSYSTGTTIVRPLLAQLKLTGSCPRKTLLDSHNFGPDSSPWRYEFSARSENWLGLTTTSGKITVRTQ